MRPFRSLLVLAGLLAALVLTALPAQALELEGYAGYQPQTRCAPKAKPGTTMLGRWIVSRYDGGFGGISRSCAGSSVSEHKEGRAFDWTLDATKEADRAKADRLLERLFLGSKDGKEQHVLARRMGIMYIIWNDRIYSAWNQFEARDYLSSGCRSKRRCSKTLRHRDHMHISILRRAARQETSWYIARLDAQAAR